MTRILNLNSFHSVKTTKYRREKSTSEVYPNKSIFFWLYQFSTILALSQHLTSAQSVQG